MAIKYIPYQAPPLRGQALLNNIGRSQRLLAYNDDDKLRKRLRRGMPLSEVIKTEKLGKQPGDNMLLRGDAMSVCAYLKAKRMEVDLVYIDPPFASGANYAKEIKLRKLQSKTEYSSEGPRAKDISEDFYGDIWSKEDYLNWIYENLCAIREVMSDAASIYVHLDWHIGHYVKVLMDEIFGEDNFVNEIVWCYSGGGVSKVSYPHKTDHIFLYTKTDSYIFNREYRSYGIHAKQGKRATDLGGKRKQEYNLNGTPVNNCVD